MEPAFGSSAAGRDYGDWMEYVTVPWGKVRLPDHLEIAPFADQFTFGPAGKAAELTIFRNFPVDEPQDDGAVGEAVAHVLMSRDDLRRLSVTLNAALEMWDERGV